MVCSKHVTNAIHMLTVISSLCFCNCISYLSLPLIFSRDVDKNMRSASE